MQNNVVIAILLTVAYVRTILNKILAVYKMEINWILQDFHRWIRIIWSQ